ncbi:hypothetical protein MB46_10290 [Arthrobacter alpinus]|uniref:DUF7322 domain-containing protein n=1 Tax=Arthrobacter alpinus TaxID=656366 RepID=UPI0005CAA476|nr:hypothetical protein [Arthrobacter alpinus]ALV45809.1 hypothetical protein MB46_10290 [Arthrobacter alpinus]
MSAGVRPSERVAAQRRRAFLWLPLLVAGALVSLAGGPMITVFNSLDAAGLALMVGGLVGFIREVEK